MTDLIIPFGYTGADQLIAAIGRIDNKITQLASDVNRESAQAEGGLNRLKGTANSVVDGLGKLGLASMGFNAIKQGVEAGVHALEGFSQAAQDDAQDVARLDQAFKNAGLSITTNSKQVQDLIAANQKLGISDDATRDSLNTLVTKTGDYNKAVQLQAVAIDLAAAKKLSLEAATKAVFRADDDSITALSKLGIQISKSATAEQNLAAIRAATAGQAQAYADTQAGSAARVADAFSEMGESVGYAVNSVIGPALKGLADWMQSPEFQAGFQGLVDSVKEGAQNVGTALNWIKDQAQPVLQFLIDHADSTKVALVAMFAGIAVAATAAAVPIVASMAPVLLIMGALAAGAFALSEAWNNDFMGMREAPMQVADLLLGSVTAMRGVLTGLSQFLEPWVNAIGGAFQQLGAVISGHAVKAGEEFHVNLVAGVNDALDGAQAKLVELHQAFADFAVKPPVLGGEAGNGFGDALNTAMYHAIPETADHMAQMAAILNSVVKPAGDSGAATGYEFISKLISGVANGEPNVQAILTWLVQNQGPKSALLWQALGVDNANIYAANLHAGLVASALQEADALKKLSDRILNQMNGMGASYADALRAQSNAMIDSALADFKASIPDWQKIGILPKPPTPPKTPKGPDLAAQARSAESAASTIISALGKAAATADTDGKTIAQALSPLYDLVKTKLPAGFEFVSADYQRLLAKFKAGKLTMAEIVNVTTADLTRLTKSSDLSQAALAQDQLDQLHQPKADTQTKTVIQAAADVTKSIADAVKAGVEAFKGLSQLQVPANLAAQTDKLAVASQLVVSRFEAVAGLWDAKALTAVGNFTDAAGKVYGLMSTAFDFLSKLADNGAKVLDGPANLSGMTQKLEDHVVAAMDHLGPLIGRWDEFAASTVGQFADASNKAYSAFSTAFGFLSTLAQDGFHALSSGANLGGMTVVVADHIVAAMDHLGPMISRWDEFAATKAGQFADASSKVYSAFSGAFDFLQNLSDSGYRLLSGANLGGMTALISDHIVAAMDHLGSMIPRWDEFATTKIGQFADASSKVYGAFSSAADFLFKLVANDRALRSALDFQALTARMSDYIVQGMNRLGGMIPAWDEFASTKVGQFADAASKVYTALSAGADFLSKLVGNGRILNSATAFDAMTDKITGLIVRGVNRFGGLISGWDEFASTKVSQFADAAGKVYSALNTAADFLLKLGDNGRILNAAINFSGMTNKVADHIVAGMDHLGAIIPRWDDFSTSKISAFADAASKVYGAFSTAFDYFTKIADTGQKVMFGADNLQLLTSKISEHIVAAMDHFGGMIPRWDEFSSAKMGAFADATGKVFGAFGSAFDFFVKLQDTGQKVLTSTINFVALADKLGENVVSIMDHFGGMISRWDEFASSKVGTFADATSKVVGSLAAGLDLLQKLADPKLALGPQAAVNALFDGVAGILDTFNRRSAEFEAIGTDKNAKLSTAVGAIVDGVSKAISPLTALATFVLPGPAIVGALFDGLSAILVEFAARSESWKAQASEEAAKLATNVGSVTDGVFKALDPLIKLSDAKSIMPSREAINNFFAALGAVLVEFAARSETFKAQATDQAARVSANVQSVMGALDTALGAVSKIAGKDIQSITPKQIDQALWVVDAALNRLSQIMGQAQFGSDWQARATQFATVLKTIFDALGTVADTGSKVGKGVDLSGLLSSIQGVLDGLAPLIAKALDPKVKGGMAFEWESGLVAMRDFLRNDFTNKAEEILRNSLGLMVQMVRDQGATMSGAWKGALDSMVADTRTNVSLILAELAKLPGGNTGGGGGTKKSTGVNPWLSQDNGLPAGPGGPKLPGADSSDNGLPTPTFLDNAEALFDRMQAIAKRWGGGGSRAIKEMGDAISAMIGGLSGTMELLTKITSPDTKLPDPAAMQHYLDTAGQFFDMFRAKAAFWKQDVTKTAAAIAHDVGGAIGDLLAPLDNLLKLGGDKVTLPSDAAIGQLFDGLDGFVSRFLARADGWANGIDDSSAKLANNIGDTVGGLLKGLDIAKLFGFTAPSDRVLDRFFDGLSRFLSAFVARSAAWAAGATDDQTKIATNIGSVFDGLLKGMNVLTSINELGNVTGARVSRAMDGLSTVLDGFSGLMGRIGGSQLEALVAFAGQMGEVFTGLKTALDGLQQFSDVSIPSADRIARVFGAMSAVSGYAGGQTSAQGFTQATAVAAPPLVLQVLIQDKGGGQRLGTVADLAAMGLTLRLVAPGGTP